jgi:hypothetical protein
MSEFGNFFDEVRENVAGIEWYDCHIDDLFIISGLFLQDSEIFANPAAVTVVKWPLSDTIVQSSA